MSRALRADDVLELSKIYEAEFNKAELHDRVLVFDVIRDGRGPSSVGVHISSPCDETNEPSQTTQELEIENEPLTTTANEKQDETVSPDDSVEDSQRDNLAEVNPSVENESENGSVLSLVADINSENYEQSNSNLTQDQATRNSTEISSLALESSDGEILRQHRFFIHGSWLAVQSTYFRSLLFSGMKESNCKEVHMKITESEEKAHVLLLEALYKVDSLDGVDVDELLAVLLLAHKYDAKFVFKKCKYCLQAASLSLEICENIMSFIKVEHAILTDVEDLAAALQSFLAKEFSPLDKTWQTTSFENLSQPSLKYLLSSDKLITQSENTVFHALTHWLARNNLDNASNEHDLASLVSVIRFELMPIDYLYNTVQHHPIATKIPDFNRHYLKGVTYHAFTAEMRQRLKVKPINRVAPAKDIIHYTWIIRKDKLDKLVSATDEELKSDPFWCCGYKMQLYLKQVSSNEHLGLQILGLANESVIRLKWIAISDSFRSLKCEHTFNVDFPTSSHVVHFALKSGTVLGSSFDTPVSGFTFSNPTSDFTFPAMASPEHFASVTKKAISTSSTSTLLLPTSSHIVSSEESPCLSILT